MDDAEGAVDVEVWVVGAEGLELGKEDLGEVVVGVLRVADDEDAVHGCEDRDVGFEVGGGAGFWEGELGEGVCG